MARDERRGVDPPTPSPDLIAIERRVARQLQRDGIWERSIARSPDLAAALKLNEEIDFLADMLNGGWGIARWGERSRALRILIRRFGRLGARHMINLVADISPLHLRLILRERTNKERDDGGRERDRIDREVEDARLEATVRRNRAKGLNHADAIFEASKEVLGRGGIEGAKKAMTRARHRARERGYVDPFAPFTATLLGGRAEEPDIKVADLARPGRPKNTTPLR